MKRVLIIAYYWPPSAGSGVQRWLKFAKYLPQNNWQPVIYTPSNPDFSLQDNDLLKEIPSEVEILKTKIWEPYHIGRALLGQKKSAANSTGIVSKKEGGLKSYLSNWIRGNLFIPDPKVFWVKPSIKYLKEYLSKNPIDAVVSTGTPHSMHLIAKGICKELRLPWVADFRDPMSQLDMLKSYHISSFRFKKYLSIEQSILKSADVVTTTSEVWRNDFEALGAKKAVCITNGYDESDFTFEVEPYSDFVISHFGLLNHLRNPISLWKSISELCEENENFNKRVKIHLGGSIDPSNIDEIRSLPHLSSKLKVFDYLSHQEVIKEYMKSSVLLLLLFNSKSGVGNIPGKLFEYLASQKDIIAFGPGDGDSKRIINETRAGAFFDYNTGVGEIKQYLLKLVTNNNTNSKIDTSQFTRQKLTKQYSNILNNIVAE